MNEQYKGIISNEKIQETIEMFKDYPENLEDIIKEINELAFQVVKKYIEEREKNIIQN